MVNAVKWALKKPLLRLWLRVKSISNIAKYYLPPRDSDRILAPVSRALRRLHVLFGWQISCIPILELATVTGFVFRFNFILFFSKWNWETLKMKKCLRFVVHSDLRCKIHLVLVSLPFIPQRLPQVLRFEKRRPWRVLRHVLHGSLRGRRKLWRVLCHLRGGGTEMVRIGEKMGITYLSLVVTHHKWVKLILMSL